MDYKEYVVKVYANGDKRWYLNGQCHRDDGPAVECADGTKFWFLNDQLHREDGPTIEFADGEKRWYLNDQLHRENGPAIEYSNGTKFWYLNGYHLTEAEFLIKTKKADTCDGKVVEIDGKKYKLTSI